MIERRGIVLDRWLERKSERRVSTNQNLDPYRIHFGTSESHDVPLRTLRDFIRYKQLGIDFGTF